MGPLRSGPMCGTDELGQYKTPDMPAFPRAQRGRALLGELTIISTVITSFFRVSTEKRYNKTVMVSSYYIKRLTNPSSEFVKQCNETSEKMAPSVNSPQKRTRGCFI